MSPDFQKIRSLADSYKPAMSKFLRDMVAIPSESRHEGPIISRIREKRGIRPEFVVCTEPSSGKIRRGQKGRMEMRVGVKGKSAHASAPERGDNAIFKMASVLSELQQPCMR